MRTEPRATHRLQLAAAFMEKAAREAKVYTSRRRRDSSYEEALRSFVEGVLGDETFTPSEILGLSLLPLSQRVPWVI